MTRRLNFVVKKAGLYIVIAVATLLLANFFDPEFKQSKDAALEVSDRLSAFAPGTPITEIDARATFSVAWHFTRCDDPAAPEYIFFYGSRDLRKAGAIFIRARVENGRELVNAAGAVWPGADLRSRCLDAVLADGLP